MTGQDETPSAALPAQRRSDGPRHAAPRRRGPGRVRLLAFAAVPTALLMGTSAVPGLASAATPQAGSCASSPDTAVTVTPVPKSQLKPVPDATKSSATGAGQAVSATFLTPKLPANASSADRTAAATQVVQAAAVQPGAAQRQDLIGDIINGISGIFDPTHQNTQTATPAPAPTPATAAQGKAATVPGPITASTPAAAPTTAPAASPSAGQSPGATPAPAPAAGSASPAPGASATASPGAAKSATPSPVATAPSAVAKSLAAGDTRSLCAVDTRSVSAAAVQPGQVVPDQNWTLKTSRLSLYGAVFGGVYEVHTPTSTKRVLKFTVSSVDIENLDMSTIQDTAAGNNPAKTFHVKSAAGSTSTMRQGPITMYVESLTGDLASLYGIPLPDLGAITLTPDTLPQWLYNLIGAIPIPIDMALTKVTAVQAGQFGGTLTIPGMRLFNDDTPYGS